MQRGILIAYFIPFLLLLGLLVASILDNENFFFILILQLFWAPVAIIHCLILFFIKTKYPEPIPKHVKIINGVFVLYVLILIAFGENVLVGLGGANFWFVLYFGIIPWSMLIYFTYIQYLILKAKGIKDEINTDILDLDIE